jgi:hypothetical protein
VTAFSNDFATYALPEHLAVFGEAVVFEPDGANTAGTGIVDLFPVETAYDDDGEHELRRVTLRVADTAFAEPIKGDGEAVKPGEWTIRGRRYRVVDYDHPPAVWVITLEAMDKERWSRPDLRRGT